MSLEFDLVVAADPFRGGADGRALADLLAGAAGRGWRVGLLPLLGPPVQPPRPVQPRLAGLLRARTVLLVDPPEPARARLALGFEALPFVAAARRPPRLLAERALLRLEAPAAAWAELVATPADLLARAGAVLGAPATLVAADPLIAASLAAAPAWRALPRAAEPWPLPAPARAPGPPRPTRPRLLRIGRHGPLPGPPGASFGPVPASIAERVLAEEAAERALLDPFFDPAAEPGLELLPGDLADPLAFLDGLDAWVWPARAGGEAMLPACLLEALAAGCPCLVPGALLGVLGEAALAVDAPEAAGWLAAADPAGRAELSARARAFAAERAGPERLIARLAHELGPPPASPPARPWLRRTAERPRRILMLSPNGVGIGHLVRLLAVARRLPGGLEPVILALSQAVGLARQMGFLAEYLPAQAATRESAERWSAGFRARLDEAIAFFDPACVVVDLNVPYQPLVDCRLAHADRPFVWLRRGFWRPDAGRATIDRGRHFDLVIEPDDLAAELDRGITRARTHERLLVPPIVLLDPEERLPRAAARAELGLDPGSTALLVALGARTNYDYRTVDRVLDAVLAARPELEAVALDWPIADAPAAAGPARLRRLTRFPIGRFLEAFDLALVACGYNSFHETLAAGLPAVLVPNENPMMDEQERRALWAEERGVGLVARASDPYRLAWALERLLEPTQRARMRARARALPACAGAAEAAAAIAQLARSWPQDRRPERLPQALARG